MRVLEGGHNIDPSVIRRRYYRGVKNLFDIYLPIVDLAFIFDNSEGEHDLIAEKNKTNQLVIINHKKFNLLNKIYESK